MSLRILLLFLSGIIGGYAAFLIGAPMPFMLGGLLGSALFIFFYEKDDRKFGKLNPYVRMCFVAATGTMIGASFTPQLLELLPLYWVSGLALLPFMLIAHYGSYMIMRHLGGYPKVDAYFASLPGGLVEAVILGEKEGADVRVLTAQHFIRVISVVIIVPLLFLLLTGEVVGSAAGETFGIGTWAFQDIGMILAVAGIGLFLGRFFKIPAGHLMGPMLLSLVLSVTGVIAVDIPPWMLHAAQYGVGTALGSQFSGISRRMLQRGLTLGLISVAYMLVLAVCFAYLLTPFVPTNFTAMFISFAAGGLAEMSLIALSLNLSPVIVALHHLVRIFLTVWVGNLVYQRGLKPRLKS